VRAALAVLIVCVSALGQESRPDSAPASRPSGPPKAGEPFRPEAADPAAKKLVSVARAHLALDWFGQLRGRGASPGARPQDETALVNLGLRLAGDVRRLEEDESMRRLVLENGIPAGDARVLPLGRFQWQKPAWNGRSPEWEQVLGVVVAAGLGDKGVQLRGEFLDSKGKPVAAISGRSVAVAPKNGLFVVAAPAKAVLGELKLLDGFQFRLIDLKPLK
jgi:hypothetical protein